MQDTPTDSQTPAPSRASSFFIDNLLGRGQDGQDAASSSSSRTDAGAETASDGRDFIAYHTEQNASEPGYCSAVVRSSYRHSPLLWNRGGTLETICSEYR